MNERRQLLEALLKQAIHDLSEGPDEQELQDYAFSAYDDAYAWVMSDCEHVGGFLWLCEMLGLDPEQWRSRILKKRRPRSEIGRSVVKQ